MDIPTSPLLDFTQISNPLPLLHIRPLLLPPHPPFVRHLRVSKSYCMLPITHKTKSWEKTCL